MTNLAKIPLTILIPTFNEAENLKALLPLLDWAAEVLVVDSFSTDDTAKVVAAYERTYLAHVYESPALQKNWAIPQCAHAWVFILDADERPTPELVLEIQNFMLQNPDNQPIDAFWIYRKNFFLDQEIRFSGWQNDKVVRLIRRDTCRYDNKMVHEEIDTRTLKVTFLKAKIEHYTYKSLDHFIDKLQRYATWSAQDYAPKTPKVGNLHLYWKPVLRFVKHYLFQQGFRDGRIGLIISVLMAWGVFLRYAKLLEMRKQV
jgi:glycosyltransferase involved in cell wall biosynthesis